MMRLAFGGKLANLRPPMKKTASKITLIATMFAAAFVFAAPSVHAADDAAKAEKKKKQQEAALKKYDKNKNGKLDPDEEAARKADAEKAKAKKKKKNGN